MTENKRAARVFALKHKIPYAQALRVTENAGLGVGHIWTDVSCPAYKSLDGKDCTCNRSPK